jgi:hypothetical protein
VPLQQEEQPEEERMDDAERPPERPDPAGAAARSMAQLAQQMREMADRMLSGGLPAWPVPGGTGRPAAGAGGAGPSGDATPGGGAATDRAAGPARPRGPAGGAAAGAGAPPGLPAVPGMPPIPGLPATPITMSARQVQAVVDDVAARRSQVRALVAQLEAFDEQLGTLETSLRPLLQWLRTWADLEGAVTDFWTPRSPEPPRS